MEECVPRGMNAVLFSPEPEAARGWPCQGPATQMVVAVGSTMSYSTCRSSSSRMGAWWVVKFATVSNSITMEPVVEAH